MRDKIRLDTYTILIVALVPIFLGVAWGLTWNYERVLATQACEHTAEYLADVALLAPGFIDARTLQDADGWVTEIQARRPPELASDLHDAVVTTVTYAMNTNPELDTTRPAGVYEALTPFQDAVDSAHNEITRKCPELAGSISGALPMFFREDNP